MSTNAAIALRTGATYQTIYCHWDGHPDTMLPMLRENYNTQARVIELIGYGDASSIDKKLEPTPGVAHTFDFPERDVCVFYHRDRGDDWHSCQSVCYTQRSLFSRMSVEYVYIFADGEWTAYYMNGRKINK